MKTIYTYSTTILIFLFSLTINANTPTGIVYQLTINDNDLTQSKKVIDEYSNLRKVNVDGALQYQFGNYMTYEAVKTIKSSLLNVGCTNVTILAYKNHISIPLSEAITIEYKNDYFNCQKTEKKVAKTITTKEVNYLLDVKKSGLQHYYSLAIPITSVETIDLILEEIDDKQVIEITIDDKLYSIGKYETFEEVIAARKQFIESEIFDVFIMAQITDSSLDVGYTQNLALTIQSVVSELAAK